MQTRTLVDEKRIEVAEEDLALPIDVVKSIVQSLTRNEPGSGANRRTTPRVAMQRCVAIIPYQHGEPGNPVKVWVRDISCGGVGIIHSRRMDIDERFLLELPGSQRSVKLVCAVIFCERLSDGLYTIGARFKQQID